MRSKVLVGLLSFCTVCLMTMPLLGEGQAAVDEAKLSNIKKLLAITGSSNLGVQLMQQMVASYQKAMPQVPEKFWKDFMSEVKADDLDNLIIPIYDRHLSGEDIQGLIAFYESPVGKKFITVLPQITQESYVAGQQWGAGLTEKVANKLKEEGYDKTAR